MSHTELDAALARLAEPLSVEDRLGILWQVAEYWYGPLEAKHGIPESELEGRAIPVPLRFWYRLGGRNRRMMAGNNFMLAPDKLEYREDGKLVFYYENQAVYVWATLPEGEDPPVYGKFFHDKSPWTEEGMSLSQFLIQTCLLEGLWQAPYGAALAGADGLTLRHIVAPLKPVPPPWHWPEYPALIYAGGGAFAFVSPNGRWSSVWIGAKTCESLPYLQEIASEEWDRCDL